MDNKVRYIIEDLLPLYNEGLLSKETAEWLEEQVSRSEEYRKLADLSARPLPDDWIEPAADHDRMLRSIQRKLSVYQLIFMAISFYLAIRTSILNESFEFILWYAVLGLITYLFYRNLWMVCLVAFVPVLLWSLGSGLSGWSPAEAAGAAGAGLLNVLLGAIWITVIHFVFAVIGSGIGWLILKLRERGSMS